MSRTEFKMKFRTGTDLLLAGLLALALGAQGVAEASENPTAVVGTFDSRAIAVAYVQSGAFREYLVAQKTDVDQALERAMAAGDESLVAQLSALGPAMQKRLHEQGFGTAPVDDILARIEDRLPAIAEEAGVDLIVSKWTLNYRNPEVRFVDVTDLIAAEFEPSERTLKMIRSTVESEPIPIDPTSRGSISTVCRRSTRRPEAPFETRSAHDAISPCSQVLAATHRRLTLRGDNSRARAVSSIVKPAK